MILVWLVARPSLAGTEPIPTAQDFEKACVAASTFQDLRPHFTAATLQTLDQLSPPQQVKAFGLLKLLMGAAAPNPKATVQIKGTQATVEFKVQSKEKGTTTSETRTYHLVREDGQWKVDFREPLQAMAGKR